MTGKKVQKKQTTSYLLVITVVLALTATVFAALYFKEKSIKKVDTVSGIHVSLGSFGYSTGNGKAIKRNDPKTTSLHAFLTKTAEKDISLGCKSSHYMVTTVSKDENQVLLHYGCEYPNANMFAIYDGKTWKTVSPTNQFNTLGMPSCTHVKDHSISVDIAPICYNNDGTSDAYTVRN